MSIGGVSAKRIVTLGGAAAAAYFGASYVWGLRGTGSKPDGTPAMIGSDPNSAFHFNPQGFGLNDVCFWATAGLGIALAVHLTAKL